jgi:2-C-methyl-D-erythritol 4-phosphate cytidylyltransferase
MLSAIIVAAGRSRRLGFDKLSARIASEPVIFHTVAAFESAKSVDEIVVVTRNDRLTEFEDMLRPLKKVRAIITGGEHRQDSVKAGLERISSETKYVAVHDGARPLITAAQIDRLLEQTRRYGAAALAEPVRDTLKRADTNLLVKESLARDQVYAMQTPQMFERRLLEEAYAEVVRAGHHVSDEVSAVENIGRKVMLIPNDDFNFKITYERDLRLAEAVLLERLGRSPNIPRPYS